jgi:Bacterial SH3 domain
MSRSLMSLCLFGAALATANALFLQSTTCPSEDKKTATLSSVRNVSSQKTASSTPQDMRSKPQKAADTASAASRDVTGSLGGGEIETPGPVDKTKAQPSKIGDEFAEWADVSIAAKVHSAPSVSAPIVRYYRVGTKLQVIERQTGWTKIVDPVTWKQGWIYEKYLTPRDGAVQTQADLRQPPEPPSAQQRKRGWRGYGAQRPRFRIMFGVYPRW